MRTNIITILLLLTLLSGAFAQSPALPTNPQPQGKFWDSDNIAWFGMTAVAVSLDGYSTQRFLSAKIQNKYSPADRPREINPLARPLVEKGAWGQVAASGIGFGATLGAAYLLHKTKHHKLERIVPFLVGTTSLVAAAKNLGY